MVEFHRPIQRIQCGHLGTNHLRHQHNDRLISRAPSDAHPNERFQLPNRINARRHPQPQRQRPLPRTVRQRTHPSTRWRRSRQRPNTHRRPNRSRIRSHPNGSLRRNLERNPIPPSQQLTPPNRAPPRPSKRVLTAPPRCRRWRRRVLHVRQPHSHHATVAVFRGHPPRITGDVPRPGYPCPDKGYSHRAAQHVALAYCYGSSSTGSAQLCSLM